MMYNNHILEVIVYTLFIGIFYVNFLLLYYMMINAVNI